MQQLQCKDRHRAIAIKWRFNSIEPIFLSGPLDSFIGDFILNNHLVEKDTSDLHLKGTLHLSPVFFLADELLEIVSSRSSSLLWYYLTSMTITTKRRRGSWRGWQFPAKPVVWGNFVGFLSFLRRSVLCVLIINLHSHITGKLHPTAPRVFQLGNTFLSWLHLRYLAFNHR